MNIKKARGILGLAGAVAGAAGAFSGFRNARAKNDKLALANAIASIVVALTGAALAVRALRKDDLA
ncbi:hypothetical protein ACFWNN_33660 [Lentzea sp. NPDC058450]|uniref:hypothetical protein n=1 Tax=Lentzea sp. NPDC058450 TaxID=3346505 RepID=UPI0036472423